MTRSLGGRLLVTLSVLLVLFFGATMVALDNAYSRALERAARERLDGQLLALIAAAEPGADGAIVLPERAPDPRLDQPSSGVYALVADATGAVVWRSRSAVGFTLVPPKAPPLGERRFRDDLAIGDEPLFALTLAVEWEDGRAFRFTVAETQRAALEQLARFRGQLAGWFALITLLFLVAQAVLLRGILRPLRQVADDVHAIQAGRAAQLDGAYPAELDALVASLNALVRNERLRLERYRNSLGDLAHALKTPLAIVRRTLEEERDPARARAALAEQVVRVDEIVEHQLQRAAASGGTTFGAPVEVRPTADKVVASLRKVHADRALAIETFVDPAARFHGDAGDLIELLGNLADNACKHARARVVVGAVPVAGPPGTRAGLRIVIGDDGAGFPEARIAELVQRGVRGDTSAPGHGIGLAIVQDLVALHGGRFALGRSDLGGAEVTVELPPV
jgi:two-component system sensor histidine kinase PhoQ